MPKNYAWTVNLASWLALALAAVQTAIFQIGLSNGHPFNPVVAAEIVILAVVGVIAAVIAKCLRNIEARLVNLETLPNPHAEPTGQALIDALQSSPHRDIEIDPERSRAPLRDVRL